jgi:hypothetical protein
VDGLFQFNRHINFFTALADAIGSTAGGFFTFWRWLSSQYRLMGDLVDLSLKRGLKLPAPTTVVQAASASATYYACCIPVSRVFLGLTVDEMSGALVSKATSGPYLVSLHHPGYYYQLAALFMVEKYRGLNAVRSNEGPLPTSLSADVVQALVNAESPLDHSVAVIDLYTKAYEQFKKYKSGRMTLFLANEIGNTYLYFGKFDMAIR